MGSDPDWRPIVDAAMSVFDVDAERIEPVRTVNNAVFRLRRGGASDLALRLHRPGHRTEANIRSELTFMSAVASDGAVIVPEPLPTRGGGLVATLDNERPLATLVTWVEGEPLSPGQGLGPRRVRRIGAVHAHLHRVAARFVPPEGFALPKLTINHLIGDALGDGDLVDGLSAPRRKRLEEVAAAARQRLSKLDQGPDSYSVIHNDLILQHFLHQRLTVGVIDFDDAGWGFHLQDLGGILGNLADYSSYRALRHNLFEGYRSVRALPSESEADFELMIALRHASVVVWALRVQDSGLMTRDHGERVVAQRFEELDRFLGAHRTRS